MFKWRTDKDLGSCCSLPEIPVPVSFDGAETMANPPYQVTLSGPRFELWIYKI
jgi:hypothetical protein